MKLQYSAMGSMGTTWIDCQDRFDYFVERAAKNHKHTTQQIMTGLLAGKCPRTGPAWDDAKIRDLDSIDGIIDITDTRKKLVCKKCGQEGHRGEYPFSTLPGSGICDDCL